MRAEAIGKGELEMLMVGNVGVNRALAGKYKKHCFYKPNPQVCKEIY